jgi:hypothetical protein
LVAHRASSEPGSVGLYRTRADEKAQANEVSSFNMLFARNYVQKRCLMCFGEVGCEFELPVSHLAMNVVFKMQFDCGYLVLFEFIIENVVVKIAIDAWSKCKEIVYEANLNYHKVLNLQFPDQNATSGLEYGIVPPVHVGIRYTWQYIDHTLHGQMCHGRCIL